jgi:hypothetical protein
MQPRGPKVSVSRKVAPCFYEPPAVIGKTDYLRAHAFTKHLPSRCGEAGVCLYSFLLRGAPGRF